MINFGYSQEMFKEEPLHPNLLDHVTESSFTGEMVHSPLVISFLPNRTHCGMINALYEQKIKQLRDAIEQRDYHRLVMLYERPYRYDGLVRSIQAGLEIGSEEYWKIVGHVWTDSENIHENLKNWKMIWKAKGHTNTRYMAMSDEDRSEFSKLPRRVRVYRGLSILHYDIDKETGLSWTTDRKKAIWFAHRFDQSGNGIVRTGIVSRNDIYAFFGGRGESEVVIDPKYITKWNDTIYERSAENRRM